MEVEVKLGGISENTISQGVMYKRQYKMSANQNDNTSWQKHFDAIAEAMVGREIVCGDRTIMPVIFGQAADVLRELVCEARKDDTIPYGTAFVQVRDDLKL